MNSPKDKKLLIPNDLEETGSAMSDNERQLADRTAERIMPTNDEIADWHFTDAKMYAEWERPLLRVLRIFVEDSLPMKKPKSVIDLRGAELVGSAA